MTKKADVFRKKFPNDLSEDIHTLAAEFDANRQVFSLNACNAGPERDKAVARKP